jgi:hypothetical protein
MSGLLGDVTNASVTVNNVVLSLGTALSLAIGNQPNGNQELAALPVVTQNLLTDNLFGLFNGVPSQTQISNFLQSTGVSINGLPTIAQSSPTDQLLTLSGAAAALTNLNELNQYFQSQNVNYFTPIVELTANTILDSSSHNLRTLVCTQAIDITANNFTIIGNGFRTRIINLSSGNITIVPGGNATVLTSNGSLDLPPNGVMTVSAFTVSRGSYIYFDMGSSVALGVTIRVSPSTIVSAGTVTVTGTLSVPNTPVSLAFSSSATVAPTTGFTAAVVSGTAYTATLTAPSLPAVQTSASTYYVWAIYNGGGSVSSPIIVQNPSVTLVDGIGAFSFLPNSTVGWTSGSIVLPSNYSSPISFGVSNSATVPPTSYTPQTVAAANVYSWSGTAPSTQGQYYLWGTAPDARVYFYNAYSTSQSAPGGANGTAGALGVDSFLVMDTIFGIASPAENTYTPENTTFTVTGTYTGVQPTSLQYGYTTPPAPGNTYGPPPTTWTTAVNPTIGNGTFSFEFAGGIPTVGPENIFVRDGNNTSSYTVGGATTQIGTAAAQETITISAIPTTQTVGVAFNVTGTMANFTSAALDYSLNQGQTWTAVSSSDFTTTTFSFPVTFNSVTSSPVYVYVRDHVNTSIVATSNQINVVAAGSAETITVNTITAPSAGAAFTVTGAYTNGPPTALDYSTDGGTTWIAAVNPTIASGSYSLSVSGGLAAGTYTVEVRDHNNTGVFGTSNSFTITSSPTYATIASQSPAGSFSQGTSPYPSSIASGTTGTAFNLGITSAPAAKAVITAYFTSTSPTTQPTTGGQTGSIIDNGNLGAWYLSAPTAAGTYYLSVWLTTSAGAAIANCVMTPITVT